MLKLALELIEQYPESIDKLTTYQHSLYWPLLDSVFNLFLWKKKIIDCLDEEIHDKFSRSAMCWETSGGQINSVQSLSHVRLFVTPWTAAHQASLSITNSQSLLKLMSIELVMPSNHLIPCHPLLPPSIFPSIRVFSNESVFRIRWLKYWGFSFNISPSSEYSGLISFRMDWLDLLAVQGTLKSLL